jgi:DNA-binding transcriptional LysR family regulator
MTLDGGVDLLRHLSFFVAVAEEGHFGHAADRLEMTQPPVSQGIRRLEQRLGVTLLTRGTQGVGLTPAGVALLPKAVALLADAQRFEDDAHGYREDRPELRIGVISQLSAWHVAAVVAAVRQAGSGIVTTTAPTVELVDAVLAGRLDCAVVQHPALIHGLECGPVLKLGTSFLVPADHRATRITQLRGLPFATVPRSHGTAAFDLLVDTLRAKGLDPSFVSSVDDRETVAAVAAGRAFGITADPHLRAPGVTRVEFAGDAFALRLRLVWRAPGPDEQVRAAIEAGCATG